MIFAPTGYPETMLIKNAYDEIELVLKSIFEGFLKSNENLSIVPVEDKILVKKMKGKILGKTLKAQAVIPSSVIEI